MILLPQADGRVVEHSTGPPREWPEPVRPLRSRAVFAAAHVVPRVLGENVPGAPADLDWDTTLAVRHRIWSSGLGVAEAVDTAQRGMGLGWPEAAELVRRSSAEARSVCGAIAAGAGTDHLTGTPTLPRVLDAYREQVEVVAGAGARVILMASRALAAVARSAEDYASVYGTLLEEADEPVVLHWLGPMFDPALRGYWGSEDVSTATETFLEVIRSRPEKVDGVKVSLLDAEREVALRRVLPTGVRLYTGDDFHYPELIVGSGGDFSDALLGIFAAVHPAASAAVQALDRDDPLTAKSILDSTEPLGRHLFEQPTFHYKTGIAFLSWLNGHQPGFSMVGGLHAGRSVPHLAEVFRLADRAGLLVDPDAAEERMRAFLAVNGVQR
ncbi:dihydrodipicolinate synthase family protein [Saccharopolyspora rhizosphaerae]|uniref:Dihydrodipicolinate synthase family protein n=1 Tax=Saccharopolyspora rhizosphaerae TaxID=2492662 RepID=A0A426JXS7_9PSEU|nr:dihydrodipicolinate synthase family protein [Saccharopolyspora rhizosphaerae]RRO17994.1 dihydrodipicolinate synthase family protein [Saccharopolyspora rhizosphaerae]